MRILKVVIIFLLSASLYAQADFTFQYDRHLSYRSGSILSAGLDLPFQKNNLGFAIGYVKLGSRILGSDIIAEGGLQVD